MSTHLSTALYDMSIIRGVSVPLGSTDENSVNVDPSLVASPLVKEVVESVPWHTYSSRKFPGIKHVNIRELGGLCETNRRSAELSLFPVRNVIGTDSNVSLGALAKGRSPSFHLNRVLRANLGYSIVGRKLLLVLRLEPRTTRRTTLPETSRFVRQSLLQNGYDPILSRRLHHPLRGEVLYVGVVGLAAKYLPGRLVYRGLYRRGDVGWSRLTNVGLVQSFTMLNWMWIY